MWGDLERAYSLDPSDPLVSLLFQITGPAHIPWQDPVWDELLTGYNVWVHIEAPPLPGNDGSDKNRKHSTTSSTSKKRERKNKTGQQQAEQDDNNTSSSSSYMILRACQLTAQHAPRTSNLAALSIHITRMLQDITSLCIAASQSTSLQFSSYDDTTNMQHSNNHDNVAAFSNRISMLGKARATAGGLNLLRILAHATIQQQRQKSSSEQAQVVEDDPVREAFTYKSRESMMYGHHNKRMGDGDIRDVGGALLSSLIEFIQAAYNVLPSTFIDIPELYDAVSLSLQLLIVLLSTQLYQPMMSSFRRQRIRQEKEHQQKIAYSTSTSHSSMDIGYFWDLVFQQSAVSTNNPYNSTKATWTPHQLVSILLQWQVNRPPAPVKSIQYYRTSIARQVALLSTTADHTNKVGPDGMYEGYSIVQASAPKQTSSSSSIIDNNDSNTKNLNKNSILDLSIRSSGSYGSQRKAASAISTTTVLSPSRSSSGVYITPHRQQHQHSHQQQQSNHHYSLAFPSSASSHVFMDATRGVLELSSNILFLPIRLLSLAFGLLHLTSSNSKHNNQNLQLLEHAKRMLQLQKHTKNSHSKNRTKDVLWLSDSPVADLAVCLLLLLINNERASFDITSNNNRESTNRDDNTSNHDTKHNNNPFRDTLSKIVDDRWEQSDSHIGAEMELHCNLENDVSVKADTTTEFDLQQNRSAQLMINFEGLFSAFGLNVHTEPGALLFYALFMASPTFAQSIAVRSDLDTLILPLLRTLYFASSLRFYDFATTTRTNASRKTKATERKLKNKSTAHSLLRRVDSRDSMISSDSSIIGQNNRSTDNATSTSNNLSVSARNCPFRSLSQLYVIVILLLLFSQDLSFGSDAFRRIHIPTVPWYKERYLKNINLGSILLLSILRCLVFNLNRLNDPFLLSNCCAVLMNLAPSVVELHDYAAMRLVAVTVSFIKRYLVLRKQSPIGMEENDEAMSSSLAQHGEVSRTLLRFIKLGLSSKNIDKNVHLIYALVYHHGDFTRLFAEKVSPFKKSQISRQQTVAAAAVKLIENGDDTRTAAKSLKILMDSMDDLRKVSIQHEEAATRRHRGGSKSSRQSTSSTSNDDDEATVSATDDFKFTYEEETDPEVFFVPYVWDVIVCVVTASSIEWNKNLIKVFPLLEVDNNNDSEEEEDMSDDDDSSDEESSVGSVIPQFARDVSDIV